MINIDEKKGQLKKISIAIILVLFLATIIITAQNIGEEIQTNNIETQTTETQENTNLQTNSETNTETETTENETTTNLCENVNCSISTLICPDSFIATCENSCIPETGTCTECSPNCIGHENNKTQPEENETENKTSELEIELSYPSKITRGEIVNIKAKITTLGSTKVKSVVADWILPQDFEIISGSLTENCGDLNPEESCISAINIQTSYSISLGKNEIKIIISYEK